MTKDTPVNCERPDELAERYVQGALGDDEQAAFEDHYFECAHCLARIQALEDARAVLKEDPRAEAMQAAAREAFVRRPRLQAWAMAAGVAAAALGAVVALRGLGTSLPSPSAPPATAAPPDTLSPALLELARVPPAPYVPLTLRGGAEDRRDFEQAMALYMKKDYAAAAAALRDVVQRRPGDLEARFYLGVAELLAGDASAARAALQPVAESEDEALRDHARFYLAAAELGQGRSDEARRLLEALAAGGAEYAARSKELLQRLNALPGTTPPERERRSSP
jgi:TolA-binding protein